MLKLYFTAARCPRFGPLCRRLFSVSGETMTDVYRELEVKIGAEWNVEVPKFICNTADKVFIEH